MKNKLLSSIAASMNAYLKLDPDSKVRLSDLAGKTVAIELLPLHFQFQLVCQTTGITIVQDNLLTADAKVLGTPLQLVGVAIAKEDRHRFFAEDIQIEGDAAIGQKMIELFDEVNIDWEEKLSTLIGDMPARQVGNFFRYIKQWVTDSESTFSQNINEYLHEETPLFPAKEALQDFYHDIDTLNMDVERMEARINVFKNKLSHEDNQ